MNHKRKTLKETLEPTGLIKSVDHQIESDIGPSLINGLLREIHWKLRYYWLQIEWNNSISSLHLGHCIC